MSRRYFGTDGIRGRVGNPPITAEFVLKLGWAVGCVVARQHAEAKVLIGKDTRISGYMFESALEAGLSAAGVDVCLLGPMPTPAIAYLTRTFKARAGIVISASHNPYYDNGIKFFSRLGTKLPDEIESIIEQQLDEPMTTVAPDQLGKAFRISDAPGRYVEFCKSTVPSSLDFDRLTVVVDCAHGATYHVAPAVFSELGARVIEMGVSPDGLNINQACGSTDPEALRQRVLSEGADLGIAFDGDGDRVIMVDHKGEIVDGDELLYIIAADQARSERLVGGVVGTKMSNLGLELALAELKIPFARTDVGDRYVTLELNERGWQLGGEGSGHILCLGATTTGDGIVSALQVLAAMITAGRTLHEIKQGMRKLPQVMINVRVEESVDRRALCLSDRVCAVEKQIKQRLAGRGRLLLRPSGTEPLIRVMIEGEDESMIKQLAQELATAVGSQNG